MTEQEKTDSVHEYLDALDTLQGAMDNMLCLLNSPFVAKIKGRDKVVDMVSESASRANLNMSAIRNKVESGLFGVARA